MIPVSKAGTSLFEILLIILWLLEGNFKDKFKQYKLNPLIITLSLLFIYSFVSLFWASSLSLGLDYLSKYRHLFIIFIIYTSLNKRFLKHILSAFLFSIFISEIISYGIFFELWQYKNISTSLPTPFLNHVDYSVYLSFSAMILLNRIFHETDIRYKLIYSLFTITITSNLLMNGGKTGQLIFLISLIIIFMQNMKNKFKAFVLSTLILAFTFTVAYEVSPNFHNRLNLMINEMSIMFNENNYKGSFPIRISFWVMGMDEFTDKISLGNGIGNEMQNIPYYAKKHGYDAEYLKQYHGHHNMYLTYGIQLGQLGFILFLLIFVSLFRLEFTSKRYANLNLIFITTFMLWSLIGTTFHLMDAMTFFALFAGLFNKVSLMEKDGVKISMK